LQLFFSLANSVFNVVGASCKRRDTLCEKRIAEVVEALQNNEISTDHGLNQEMNLKRPGDTRWSSHYGVIINLIIMFSSIVEAVEDIVENDLYSEEGLSPSFIGMWWRIIRLFVLLVFRRVWIVQFGYLGK
jgi:hypothetical protein